MLTTDRGILRQQNISGLDIVVVVVLEGRSNALEALAPLLRRANEALPNIGPGQAPRVVEGA